MGRSAGRGRDANRRNVVNAMNREERQAAFAIERAKAYEVSLAHHSVKTAGKPKPATTPSAEEIEALVDSRVAAKLAEHDVARQDGIGAVISHERKRTAAEIDKLRAEITKAMGPPIKVDILDDEMSKGLPYWLDPVVQYSGRHDERRRENQINHATELQATRARERAERGRHA